MSAFIREWSDCFKTKSANHVELAQRYVGGLLSQTARKNMERMDERLGHNRKLGTDTYQATQQFISDSARSGIPLAEIERAYIQAVLKENNGNKAAAARSLSIDRSTLYRKL